MVEHDKAAIIELMNLYAFALDTAHWDLFDRIFAEDILADFGPASAVWRDLASFKRAFGEFHATLDNYQHTMMGHLVHVNGDTAHAFAYGNWLLVREAAKGGSSWLGTGWYDDELVRTAAGWRIKRRVCRLLSWTGNPAVPEPNRDQSPDMKTNTLRQFGQAGNLEFLKAITAK